jgi:hypothetical protein
VFADHQATEVVSALIYDPFADSFLLMLPPPKGSTSAWRHFQVALRDREHPILGLRRGLSEHLGIALAENAYYYLETTTSAATRENTQYLVLVQGERCRKPEHLQHMTFWVPKSALHSLRSLTEDCARALERFRIRFGAPAERNNLQHMLLLSARSP